MNDYIKRADVLKESELMRPVLSFDSELREAVDVGRIIALPAANVEKVRHAYNKCEKSPSLFECSACGEECNDTLPWDHPKIEYCPRCGAKIIGEMEYKMLYHSAFPDGKENEDGRTDR